MADARKAFTLTELMMVVLVLGILVAVTVPRMNFAVIIKNKTETTAKKIITDLRRARSLAISNAADNTSGYGLHMTGSAPYGGYEIVNLDDSATVDSLTVDADISCTGGSSFDFGPLGNLLLGSDDQLTVSGGGKSFTISVISVTGTVRCVEN